MKNENILEQFAEVDRKIWEAGGGTVHGFMGYCRRFAEEDHPQFVAEMERRKAQGTWKSPFDKDGEEPAWANGESPDYAGAVCVCEGNAPKYGVASDSARKGAEGDAE